jgi:hypothetical protein
VRVERAADAVLHVAQRVGQHAGATDRDVDREVLADGAAAGGRHRSVQAGVSTDAPLRLQQTTCERLGRRPPDARYAGKQTYR